MTDLRDVTEEEYQVQAPRPTKRQVIFNVIGSIIVSSLLMAVMWLITSGALLLGLRIWGARI